MAAGRAGTNQTNRYAQEVDVPKLVVFRGDAVENEVRLTGNTVRIGRHTRNEVVLDDALNGVSRFHAEVRPEGGRYFIVDLNSRNGVWINGRRINTKAPLELGVPATVGAFELALEDDASGSFVVPPASQRTVVSSAAASTDVKGGSSRSASQPRSAGLSVSPRGRQILLWSGAAAVVLLLCAITFAVVRYRTRPAPVVAVEQPPPVPQPVPAALPPEPPVNPNIALNEQDLTAAREQIAAGDFAGAVRDHLQPVLERDPENAAALELKKQADDAAAATAKTARIRPPKPEPAEAEAPGIPKKPGELGPDYASRVKLIQTALADGKSSLDKQDYVAALNRFRVVDREQPKYQGVDALIADTVGRQQKATEVAVTSGQQNEQAGKLLDARRWYERALQIDPASTSARERRASVVSRMNTEATRLYNAATFALKSQDTAGAIAKFQQILDMLMPGDEIREKAAKELEALKR